MALSDLLIHLGLFFVTAFAAFCFVFAWHLRIWPAIRDKLFKTRQP